MANVKVAIRLFVYKDIKYMGTIAKGEITLSTVNDAYTVSLSNPVCAIHADFDGSHPQLDNATTLVTVKRGDKPVKFEITDGSVSVNGVEHLQSTRIDDYQWRLTWRSVNTNALEGYGTIQLMTLDGFAYSTTIEWKYSILRESTMLDWIQDWEGGKTKIGSAYIMTPKMFIGKKDDYGQYVGQVDDIAAIPGLTGVYIGPDNLSAGIYGYKDSVEIFHLNEEGGKIGGWDINSETISCGNLWLDSHGSILARNDEGDKIWWLKENGYAEFAFGNVKFYANGNAEYTGEITATGGTIGGWSIHNNQLESPAGCTFIDGIAGALGICAGVRVQEAVTGRTLIEQSVRGTGGVAMFYNSANSFGLIGYVPSGASAKQVFAVGSTNYIAGWNFTTDSLYLGANKNNTKRKYTSASGEITLGTNGIRGNAWYLDNDGVASFAGDKIHFEADSGTIVGWKVNNNRLSTNNVALVSVDGYYGLYLTQASNAGFNSWAASALSTHIEGNGGIYIQTNNSRAVLAAYNTSGQKLFGLFSNGTSTIAGWKFNNDSLFTGNTAVTNAASYAASGCISLGPTGIFGSKWKLLGDGSGSLASGKIAWAADGTITFDAPVSANNITAGTISTANIKASNGSWLLNQDGSGSLASGKIAWDKGGLLQVKKSTLTDVTINGSIRTPFCNGYYVIESGESSGIGVSTVGLHNNNNVILTNDDKDGFILGAYIPWTKEYNGFRAIVMNDDFNNATTYDMVEISAPSGKYFFEDGRKFSKLSLRPNTGVEMIGYGDGSALKGWMIINRIIKDYGSHNAGFRMRIMYSGVVANGALGRYKSYDGDGMTVTRTDTGRYTLKFDRPFSSANNYMVFVTGYAVSSQVYACVMGQTSTGFDVYTGDDSSANDGGFAFMVVNTAWNWENEI